MKPYRAPSLPRTFIWRRLHSITGLWLVIFLIEHLFTNSQAALFFEGGGMDFVRTVNSFKDLPYLHVIEISLLGIPLLIHGWWGVKYVMTAKYNSFSTDGSAPSLPQYVHNQGYTWQRITSWILLIAIIAHVIHMRFLEYPASSKSNTQQHYMIRLKNDDQLEPLSKYFGFKLYNPQQFEKFRQETDFPDSEKKPLNDQETLAVSSSFGVVELLMLRETFKNPLMVFLYSIFVIAACFHAFNGLWTFMISWGLTLTARSQQLMWVLAVVLMGLVSFLGFAAIWGT